MTQAVRSRTPELGCNCYGYCRNCFLIKAQRRQDLILNEMNCPGPELRIISNFSHFSIFSCESTPGDYPDDPGGGGYCLLDVSLTKKI